MMNLKRFLFPLIGLALVALGIMILEEDRQGLQFKALRLDGTPVTRISDGTEGPVVVLAHGFAGSRQVMHGYAQTLAHGGYTVFSFDFEGHGRHARPMQGGPFDHDKVIDALVAQTQLVVNGVRNEDLPVALVGFGTADDVLLRVAKATDGVGPMVLLSASSAIVTSESPDNLLLISGAWPKDISDFAFRAIHMIDPSAVPGELVQNGRITRQTNLIPMSDQITILHSGQARQDALAWLDRYYDRAPSTVPSLPIGWALLALLTGLIVLFRLFSEALPYTATWPQALTRSGILVVSILPALVTPILTYPVSVSWLPGLALDDLIVHMATYGVLQILLLIWLKRRLARADLAASALLAFWAVMIFGMALDRYGANFWPAEGRLSLIAALTVGTVPFMIADNWMTDGAPLWHRIVGRVTFIASLMVAVAFDPDGLSYLLVIAPALLMFWFVFGLLARMTRHRSGPTSAGLGLGLALAWALGVSVPLFVT